MQIHIDTRDQLAVNPLFNLHELLSHVFCGWTNVGSRPLLTTFGAALVGSGNRWLPLGYEQAARKTMAVPCATPRTVRSYWLALLEGEEPRVNGRRMADGSAANQKGAILVP